MISVPQPVRQFLEAVRDGGPWFRRGVITGLGTVCVAVAALWIGHSWQTRPPPQPKVVGKPLVIIDGPPTNVKPAPPPPVVPARRDRLADEDADDGPDEADAGPALAQPAVDQGAQEMQGRSDFCAGLSSPADRLVCASPRLGAEDERLRRLYRMALAYSPDPGALRDEQRRWAEVRERVAASGDPQALGQLYEERINELSGPG